MEKKVNKARIIYLIKNLLTPTNTDYVFINEMGVIRYSVHHRFMFRCIISKLYREALKKEDFMLLNNILSTLCYTFNDNPKLYFKIMLRGLGGPSRTQKVALKAARNQYVKKLIPYIEVARFTDKAVQRYANNTIKQLSKFHEK